MRLKRWMVLCLGLTLSACATTPVALRPVVQRSCAFSQIAYPTGYEAFAPAAGGLTTQSMRRVLAEALAARDTGAPTTTNPLEWLALSGGGQWGAYGAGFLSGWSQAGDRPEFDVVTGVSTGAMMSVFAFLGSENDSDLKTSYTLESYKQYVRKFSLFSLPRKNSVYATDGLRSYVLDRVQTLSVMDRVAAEAARGRKLMIGVVDVDNGGFYAIDLTRLAGLSHMSLPDKEQCMTDYIMASAAIPVIFPPVFIDGHMLVDGSARANAFVGDLTSVARVYGKRAINIYVVQNGVMRIQPRNVRNRLLPIAVRSAEIFVDSISDASFIELIRQSRTSGETKFVTADASPCVALSGASSTVLFQPDLMSCLLTDGQKRGANPTGRWNPDADVAGIP